MPGGVREGNSENIVSVGDLCRFEFVRWFFDNVLDCLCFILRFPMHIGY